VTALRYGRVSMLLHWLIGIALLGQIAFGFLLDEIAPRNTPARTGVINLHKSFGIVLGLLIVARLAWRLLHRPPPWPEWMSSRQRTAAEIGHRALYACMFVMPLSGYVASNFSKYGLRLFGLALQPWGLDLPQVYAGLNGVHVVTAFVFCALISGHVLVALKHVLVGHHSVFARMWPEMPTRLAPPSSTSPQASP
jgi:cytochrome b561